ncbi:MAG: hypothetical protein CVT64_04055 [Actinobacteria bacterium HGW-Actinobacteria-4]|nr:MAG: hypothetical protein CVT64_04055 [Actinobacteria bacterium HGW-Actinobacteria-4]
MTETLDTYVEIRPESDILETYRRLSYLPWYAIAEFVDNATWNFEQHKEAMSEVLGAPAELTVAIFYDRDKGTLSIADDSNGMGLDEFKRAMQLAKPPTNTSGRSEFGMGLKTAACWMGPRWEVTSKRLGDTLEFHCGVDLARLKADRPESLNIGVRGGIDEAAHYTRVDIEGMHEYDRVFVGRTIGKIKSELASIYRRDLQTGQVRITFNGETLSWDTPSLLDEQFGSETRAWRKPVNFEVHGLRVTGWIGLLAKGRAADAGFHLFRRGRLIQGGPSQGWKPWEIFKAVNSFQSQRLIGELDFDDWRVSHTKDSLDMSGAAHEELVDQLEALCSDYIAKAKESRKDEGRPGLSRAAAESVVEDTRDDLVDSEELGAALAVIEQGVFPSDDPDETASVEAVKEALGDPVEIRFGGTAYPTLSLVLSDLSSDSEPLARVGFPADDAVTLVLNLRHPFVTRFVGDDERAMKLLAHSLYVDALVERISRKHRNLSPAQLRLVKDSLLRELRSHEA